MKFKPGMKVKLVAHSRDSDNNLTIGARGYVATIAPGQAQSVLVTWEDYDICPDWWVTDDIIRPVNIQLENK